MPDDEEVRSARAAHGGPGGDRTAVPADADEFEADGEFGDDGELDDDFDDEDEDDDAPGWDAIDAALARIYLDVEPLHYGTVIKWMMGGPDPLDGISAYPRPGHWHLVSYGMSELYCKESEDPDESGWGFEFTFRVARTPDETEPPAWALNFLQALARYVVKSGNPFGPGHHLDLNGPIALTEADTAIRAVTFVEDPELGGIDTPHGRLRFLQVVGITLDEYAAIERWDAGKLLPVLARHLPLLVTDIRRADLTGDPAVAAAIEDGVRRDGSNTGAVYVQEAGWRMGEPEGAQDTARSGAGQVTVTFGAVAAERIGRVLAARLPFGRGFLVQAPESRVGFLPGDQVTVTDQGEGLLEIQLPAAVLDELIAVLRPVAASHRLAAAPGLTVEIVKSRIRDQSGEVVREIG